MLLEVLKLVFDLCNPELLSVVIMSTRSLREWLKTMPEGDDEFHHALKTKLSKLLDLHESDSKKDETIKKLKNDLRQQQFVIGKIQQAKQHLEQKLTHHNKQTAQLKEHKETIAKLTKLNQQCREVKKSAMKNYANAAGEVQLLLDLLWDMYKSYNNMIDKLKKLSPDWTEDDDSQQELIKWVDSKNKDVIESILKDLENNHHHQSDYTICMTHSFEEEKDRVEKGSEFDKHNIKREDLF